MPELVQTGPAKWTVLWTPHFRNGYIGVQEPSLRFYRLGLSPFIG
jgi:hypothetical protein